MDFNPNAKLNRIANGNLVIHACLHNTVKSLVVDA